MVATGPSFPVAFLRRVDEGTLSRLLVESNILLAAVRPGCGWTQPVPSRPFLQGNLISKITSLLSRRTPAIWVKDRSASYRSPNSNTWTREERLETAFQSRS